MKAIQYTRRKITMMSLMWGYGLFMFFGMTLWVVLFALLIWALIRWLNRRTGQEPSPGAPEERSALEILRQRYARDRKSTRLNSSHSQISYAVFCLTSNKLCT